MLIAIKLDENKLLTWRTVGFLAIACGAKGAKREE